MDKIGILTFHHVVNWGSALQAVGVYKILKNIYPKAKIEIIDYTPLTSFNYNQQNTYKINHFLKLPYRKYSDGFVSKHKACKFFVQKHTKISNNSLISNDLKKFERFIKAQNYDIVFVGSDQVFQLGPNSHLGNYIAAPQAPNAYFLPFSAKFEKIGFAVTANPYHKSLLEKLDTPQIRDILNDFKFIYYRDAATNSALIDIGIDTNKTAYLPDPSLMFDFNLICNDEIRLDSSGGPLAAVAVGNRDYANSAMKKLIELGFRVVNLLGGDFQNRSVINLPKGINVESFINLHRQFSTVVTDRFHGSIMTMMMAQCPLIGIEESAKYPGKNSKVRDLYQIMSLENYLWESDSNLELGEFIGDRVANKYLGKNNILEKIYQIRSKGYKNLSKLDE
jgi:hypothetical protein